MSWEEAPLPMTPHAPQSILFSNLLTLQNTYIATGYKSAPEVINLCPNLHHNTKLFYNLVLLLSLKPT